MLSALSPSVRAPFPVKTVAALTCLSAALLAALVLVPSRLAAQGDSSLTDRQVLAADLQDAFVAYWRSGERGYPPDLARVVDYWARYSIVEAVITSALLVALVALGRLLWRAYLRGDDSGQVKGLAVAAATTVVWGCALVAVWTLTASIQDASAPFTAVLPMLREGADHAALTQTLDQVRQHLAPSTSVGAPAPPALAAMADGNARFHVVHAIAAAPTAIYFLMSGVLLWKRRTQVSERRVKRTVKSAAVVCVLLSLFVRCDLRRERGYCR